MTNKEETEQGKKIVLKNPYALGVGVLILSLGLLGTAHSFKQPSNEARPTIEEKKLEEKGKSDFFSDEKKQNKKGDKKEANGEVTEGIEDYGKHVLDKFDVSTGGTSGFKVDSSNQNKLLMMAMAETLAMEKEMEAENKLPNDNLIAGGGNTHTPPPTPPTQPKPPVLPPVIEESTPVIEVTSKSEVLVQKNTPFLVNNYFRVFDIKDENVAVTVDTSDFDISKSGSQTIRIYAKNKFGRTAYQELKFYVNAAPVLKLAKGNAIHLGIDDLTTSLLEFVTAQDDEDGDLTGSIRLLEENVDREKEGKYYAEFKVTDSRGYHGFLRADVFVENEAPVFTYKTVHHEINQPFNALEGVSVNDKEDGKIDVTEDMVVENNVDVTKEGQYTVTYQTKDSHGKQSKRHNRTVFVENEAPKLVGVEDVTLHVNETLTKEQLLKNITVTDREDDRLGLKHTATLIEKEFEAIDTTQEGQYPLTYKAVDSMGKETLQTIQVKVINDAPMIKGVEEKTIIIGESFDDLEGVSVTDTETRAEDVTLDVTGEVNETQLGDYELTYTATDGQGKQSIAQRRVTVTTGHTPSSLPKFVGGFAYPLENYTISSPYGQRGGEFHRGTDFAVGAGTPIGAIADGKVIISDYHYSWGEYVVIQHSNGMTSLYAHQSKRLVNVGAEIKQGDVIGLVGSTGNSSGAHLHLEINQNSSLSQSSLIDPMSVLGK